MKFSVANYFASIPGRIRRGVKPFIAFVIALCLWAPFVHLFFQKSIDQYRGEKGVSPTARALAATHLAIWTDPDLRKAELTKMRKRNPEWDFMSRTFFVLALANMAMRDSAYHDDACEIIDAIIEDTLEVEEQGGYKHFLLGYGHTGGWVVQPPRSLFVDGEIAVMIASRRLLEEKLAYRLPLTVRVETMISRMNKSPVLWAESYPDECWLFCNVMALAAIRVADVLDDTNHSEFLASWVLTAKENLIEPRTGLLISALAVDGTPSPSGFGPEGSTIWTVSHLLQIVDRQFAADQYRRAKAQLARTFIGLGYSREWPPGLEGPSDIDSGPIVPLLNASAGASGQAILAAAAFGDKKYFGRLMTSLEFGGFPERRNGTLRYAASNPVGDAVLLYALTEGPLWAEVQRRMEE